MTTERKLRLNISLKIEPVGSFDRPLVAVGCQGETIPSGADPMNYIQERTRGELYRLVEQWAALKETEAAAVALCGCGTEGGCAHA